MKKLLVFVVLITINVFSPKIFADSSVWKISKGEDYFYLGGTVHLLTQSDHPLPDEFSFAYNDAGAIFFETDLVEMQTPEFQSRLMALMTYSDERTLASQLDQKTYDKLQDFLAARQIPMDHFAKLHPWGVSLMITMIEYQRFGMMPDYGVDTHFSKLALADSKIISGLETTTQQLQFLASMGKTDPNLSIEYTLHDLENLPKFIELMKTSWRSGDLESLSTSPLVVKMKMEFPEMYNTLITKRNNAWMEQLPVLFEDKAKEFVLVGALHLAGEDGLLNQLKLQGFEVEQL